MNKLPSEKRAQIIRCLVEGNSIRGTARLNDVVKNTVIRLLVETGEACAAYQDAQLRNLTCRRLQLDEIWAFVGAKSKNANPAKKIVGEAGDVWTWVALCA